MHESMVSAYHNTKHGQQEEWRKMHARQHTDSGPTQIPLAH